MSDLTLICGDCRQPVIGDTGYLYVDYADIHAARDAEKRRREVMKPGAPVSIAEFLVGRQASWKVTHDRHRSSDGAYYIDAAQFDAWPKVAHWTAHLLEKTWIQFTDWDDVLRELAGDIPSRRIRVAAREAA